MLRAEAGRDLYDRRLTDLIGELSTRSEEFRHRWAAHNVRMHTTGVKLLHHPVVGDLDLPFETFPVGGDPSQVLLTYTAEPASPSRRHRAVHAGRRLRAGRLDRDTRLIDPWPAPSVAPQETVASPRCPHDHLHQKPRISAAVSQPERPDAQPPTRSIDGHGLRRLRLPTVPQFQGGDRGVGVLAAKAVRRMPSGVGWPQLGAGAGVHCARSRAQGHALRPALDGWQSVIW